MNNRRKQIDGRTTTDIRIKALKAGQTIPCGGNLVCVANDKGIKTFRLRYKFGGKPYIYTIGKFGKEESGLYSLKKARAERDRLKAMIEEGLNPSLEKKKRRLGLEKKVNNTLESLVIEWFDTQKDKRAESTNKKNLARIKRYIFPTLGAMPIDEIDTSHLFKVFAKLGDKFETASKIKEDLNRAFSYAVVLKVIKYNCFHDFRLREVVKKKEEKSHPHLSESELPEFFYKLYSVDNNYLHLLSLHFIALTFLRLKTARFFKWEYVHWDKKELKIPASEMKMKKPFTVPISKQLMIVLQKIKELNYNSEYLFPSYGKEKVISEHASLNLMHRAGYKGKMCNHGWRHIYSTILNESLQFNKDAIEVQLHHTVISASKVSNAYNDAQYMDERIKIMNWWGDKLEELGMRF